MEACFLSVAEAARAIREKRLNSETLVRSCLNRIESRDDAVKAWVTVDAAGAIAAARESDKRALRQSVSNAQDRTLQGIPFGVKDMIDTADLPTTYNSYLYQGHRPSQDASCVRIVKHAGAVLLGKADTVEFASFGRRAATRHPRNPAHTPGGSSSGSAAAVADYQVPFAFGTQTGGSLIRPASFNGIYALKPSWGRVSTYGARLLSASLDTIGWYGRSVEDLRLIANAFHFGGLRVESNNDEGSDWPTSVHPADLAVTLPADLPLSRLRVGVCRSPQWSMIEPSGERALQIATERLAQAGVSVSVMALPPLFDDLLDAQRTIMHGEAQAAFRDEYLSRGEQLDPGMAAIFQDDALVGAQSLRDAYGLAEQCRVAFAGACEGFDVLLTPASAGEAPEGLADTGRSVFNAMWTVLHAPCLAIPCTTGVSGLPVGVQLVAPRHADAQLLALASRLAPIIDAEIAESRST